jgi:endoglycosylceramidase
MAGMKRAGTVVLACALLATLAADAAASAKPPFSHQGRWITDARGRVMILHGLNMVNKLPPYRPDALGFGTDDARFLARHGFNTMRVGIIYKGLEATEGSYDDAYLSRILATTRVLSKRGIWPLVDFHQDMYNEVYNGEGFPDWAVQDDGLPRQPDQGFPANYIVMPALSRAYDHFWANDPAPSGRGLQDAYAAAWRHVAERFRGERRRGLVGYDIFNEPWPGSGWQSCANTEGCPVFDTEKLTPFSLRVFQQIRQADPRSLTWYEPNLFINFGSKTHHGDTGDARAGMSFHLYCVGETPGVSSGGSQTGGCSRSDKFTLDNAEAQSQKTGDALILSEFGATDAIGTIERVIKAAETAMVSWQYWSYWNEDVCCKRPVEGVINDIRKPPVGDNVKAEKLKVLARAYPQAVAGTPTRYGFDPESAIFELEYSTARAGGGKFGRRALTEVFAPRLHYPGGYRAEVTGARVVSRANARRLLLRNRPGAKQVTLRVRPR